MQLNGNLLIVGDSFCQNSEYWPTYFADRVLGPRGQFRCLGYGGASWWFLRDKLLQLISHEPVFWVSRGQFQVWPEQCIIYC